MGYWCGVSQVYSLDGNMQSMLTAFDDIFPGNTDWDPAPPFLCGNFYACNQTPPTATSTSCQPDPLGIAMMCANNGTVTPYTMNTFDPDGFSPTCNIGIARLQRLDKRTLAVARANGIFFTLAPTLD